MATQQRPGSGSRLAVTSLRSSPSSRPSRNLLSHSGYYDIALRDFGLLIGALALGRLAAVYDPPLRRGNA